jgi:hypothetical protein
MAARFPGGKHYVRREVGEVGVITLAAAREQAREWLVAIKEGVDPTLRRAPVQLANNSFAHVAESFITRHLPAQRKGDLQPHRSKAGADASSRRWIRQALIRSLSSTACGIPTQNSSPLRTHVPTPRKSSSRAC